MINKTKILKDIESHTTDYSKKCDILHERLQWLKDEQEQLRRVYLKGIIAASRAAKSSRIKLKIKLAEYPEVFIKPRTHIYAGVRVGYKKNKGKFTFPENIIDLIKKKLPASTDSLIKATERPVASAVSNLSAADLKKIGVTVTNCTDEIVVTNTDNAVEKMVQEIMKDEQYDEKNS